MVVTFSSYNLLFFLVIGWWKIELAMSAVRVVTVCNVVRRMTLGSLSNHDADADAEDDA